MKPEFYKHVELDSEIEELKSLLNEHNIAYEVSSAEVIIDKAIIGEGLFAKYTVKLHPHDFEKVNKLLRDHADNIEVSIDDFPHLRDLSNDELIDILVYPKDWSIESGAVAKKILDSRSCHISDQEIKNLRERSFAKQRTGKSVSFGAQVFYFLSIVFFGFYASALFFVAGVAMGYYYSYGKATDPEGQKYYVYDEPARRIGKFILYGGLGCLFLQIYLLDKFELFDIYIF